MLTIRGRLLLNDYLRILVLIWLTTGCDVVLVSAWSESARLRILLLVSEDLWLFLILLRASWGTAYNLLIHDRLHTHLDRAWW